MAKKENWRARLRCTAARKSSLIPVIRKNLYGILWELAFKGENIPFLMRDRLRWATPVLPSADAYAAVGHRDYSRIGL